MLDEIYLNTQSVVKFEMCSYASIMKKIERGSIKAFKISVDGKQGFEYRIPLSELSPQAQQRYFAQVQQTESHEAEQSKTKTPSSRRTSKINDLTLKDLTEEQREKVYFWKDVFKQWNKLLAGSNRNRLELTRQLVKKLKTETPTLKISERTIYRKWTEYKANGDIALVDFRTQGKNGVNKKTDKVIASIFGQYYLSENRPAVTTAYSLTEEWARNNRPDLLPLPSIKTFYRLVKGYPEHTIKYFRYGEKVFEDKCMPYIVREYESFGVNEVWSSDYHTLDIMVKDDVTGALFRPHLICWIDVRSRKILTFYLAKTSNSDGTFISFKNAVKQYGIPQSVYLDNGREFLVSDIGGRGRRKTDKTADYGTTLFERLGIEMTNAIVQNGKAKIIERIFRNIKYDFSKLVDTYTGGKPEERPERYKDVIKDKNNIPTFSEMKEALEYYITGIYNKRPSKARGLNGLCPDEYYDDNLISKKLLTHEQEELLLLRTQRAQTVTRNGVKFIFDSEELWYYNTDLIIEYLGEKVYLRYDPEDMKAVQVYDSKERFICTAELTTKGGYNLGTDIDKEAIKENNSRKRKLKGSVKSFMKNLEDVAKATDPIELMKSAARRNIEEKDYNIAPKVLEPFSFSNLAVSKSVEDVEEIPFETMIKNAQLRRVKNE